MICPVPAIVACYGQFDLLSLHLRLFHAYHCVKFDSMDLWYNYRTVYSRRATSVLSLHGSRRPAKEHGLELTTKYSCHFTATPDIQHVDSMICLVPFESLGTNPKGTMAPDCVFFLVGDISIQRNSSSHSCRPWVKICCDAEVAGLSFHNVIWSSLASVVVPRLIRFAVVGSTIQPNLSLQQSRSVQEFKKDVIFPEMIFFLQVK